MKEYIDKTEEYLSELVNYFNCIDNCVEKINIITKINELVFWLQMYQDNYLWEENRDGRIKKQINWLLN